MSKTKKALHIEVSRGYVDQQFIRNRYTLMVETRIGEGDTRKCCWEFGGRKSPRFMGYISGSEVVARLTGELNAAAERFEP
jgi:hypothetical protein